MSRGTDFKIITLSNRETDEEVDVYVRYSWYYAPGVHTMPNGDPGYPDESEIEIKDFHLSEAPNDPIPDWVDEGMIEEAIWEAGDVFTQDSDYDFDY
jgi:hypothetical protein